MLVPHLNYTKNCAQLSPITSNPRLDITRVDIPRLDGGSFLGKHDVELLLRPLIVESVSEPKKIGQTQLRRETTDSLKLNLTVMGLRCLL